MIFCKLLPDLGWDLPPHESVLYPVQVSQLSSHNADNTKHRPKLSYVLK